MEGNKLFYKTKMCDSTACRNHHMVVVEKIETNIVVFFDIHALNNGIIPKSATVSTATHLQYMDINGTIHIRPNVAVPVDSHEIVNFRLIASIYPFTTYASLDTPLEPVNDIYQKHLVKQSLELRYDRHFRMR